MENCNITMEAFKVGSSTMIAYIVCRLGASWRHIAVLLAFMAADTLIGWLVAAHLGKWKSSVARWGFAGKIVELVFVAMLYLLDWLFGTDTLKYIGIYYFIICEGASFVENIAKVNKNIPKGLVDILKAAQSSAGSGIVKLVKKYMDKLGGDDDEQKP